MRALKGMLNIFFFYMLVECARLLVRQPVRQAQCSRAVEARQRTAVVTIDVDDLTASCAPSLQVVVSV